MGATTTSRSGLSRSVTRCIRWETRLGLAKNPVCPFLLLVWTTGFFDVCRPPDIYIVADAEGHEMVLKLHRYAHVSVYESVAATVNTPRVLP